MAYGKWIGAWIGAMSGGVLGALAGFAIGSIFDKMTTSDTNDTSGTDYGFSRQQEQVIMSFLLVSVG